MGVTYWRRCEWDLAIENIKNALSQNAGKDERFESLYGAFDRGIVNLHNRIRLGRELEKPMKILQPLFASTALHIILGNFEDLKACLNESMLLAEPLNQGDILRAADIPYALLHCTNVYPTPYELVRINAINTLADEFPDAVIGLSDHTLSNDTCVASVALGASILERHFTDSMQREGPDIMCSMDPSALRELIQSSKNIFLARGDNKTAVESENPTIAFAFASVVAIKDIRVGEELTEQNIWVKRPGGGDFSAEDYEHVLGKTARQNIQSCYQISKSKLND